MGSPSTIQLLDTVALLTDVPALGLSAGEVGAVVEVLSEDAFEVELCDESGYTYGLHTLRAHQLVRLHSQGHPFANASKRPNERGSVTRCRYQANNPAIKAGLCSLLMTAGLLT